MSKGESKGICRGDIFSLDDMGTTRTGDLDLSLIVIVPVDGSGFQYLVI